MNNKALFSDTQSPFTPSRGYFCASSTEDSNNATLLCNWHKIGIHQGGLLSPKWGSQQLRAVGGDAQFQTGVETEKRHGSSMKMHAVTLSKHKRDAFNQRGEKRKKTEGEGGGRKLAAKTRAASRALTENKTCCKWLRQSKYELSFQVHSLPEESKAVPGFLTPALTPILFSHVLTKHHLTCCWHLRALSNISFFPSFCLAELPPSQQQLI